LKKIVKPLWQWIIFSIARVYAGSSGVALRNFTMVAAAQKIVNTLLACSWMAFFHKPTYTLLERIASRNIIHP